MNTKECKSLLSLSIRGVHSGLHTSTLFSCQCAQRSVTCTRTRDHSCSRCNFLPEHIAARQQDQDFVRGQPLSFRGLRPLLAFATSLRQYLDLNFSLRSSSPPTVLSKEGTAAAGQDLQLRPSLTAAEKAPSTCHPLCVIRSFKLSPHLLTQAGKGPVAVVRSCRTSTRHGLIRGVNALWAEHQGAHAAWERNGVLIVSACATAWTYPMRSQPDRRYHPHISCRENAGYLDQRTPGKERLPRCVLAHPTQRNRGQNLCHRGAFGVCFQSLSCAPPICD